AGENGLVDSARCPDARAKGDRGPVLDATGSRVQAAVHAAAKPVAAHYATSMGEHDGASMRGLGELDAGKVDFAGSEVPSPRGDVVNVPILIDAVGIIYTVKGVSSLRLSPATLAKIFQHEITTWNDPAIARDNPGTK